jgi:hypothetical protein
MKIFYYSIVSQYCYVWYEERNTKEPCAGVGSGAEINKFLADIIYFCISWSCNDRAICNGKGVRGNRMYNFTPSSFFLSIMNNYWRRCGFRI